MRNRVRFNFAEFLSEPRFLHEIVEHYGVSRKTTVFHLREAMKSGKILISEFPVFRTIKDSSGNLTKLRDSVYVYRESPILVGMDAKLLSAKAEGFRSDLKARYSKNRPQFVETALGRGETKSAYAEKVSHQSPKRGLKVNHSLISKLKASAEKVSSVKYARSNPPPEVKPCSSSKPTRQLNAEKIRFIQALQKEPLPFTDLRTQFNVPRQTITRLVKKGLLEEIWGSNGVGVRFKLTGKGKAWLAELEEASRFEPRIRESSLTRLKQRSIV